ncbi:glycosyltransferase family 2 protein [Sediminibacter sp. Hel_I_10]|uniref:glycosyltransferase family 2 protein n=1 Tax=Sediminibacter sp. Hel_I_10 TaxID=1392490 RepID=UPI000479FFE1|nr:glycosyltransferase family 2 protein [Sediminibacter sp. Hel_I_10]
MKLSVVIPVYNAAEFIEKSYRSIAEQNLKDFEIIYVNNNSIDNSIKKINKILTNDKRVKLIEQPKQGAAAARNLGIEEAHGDYIYVFDVDDEIYPNALNAMICVLDSHPKAHAVFGKMVKSKHSIAKTIKPEDETNEVIIKEKPYWGLAWFADLSIVVGPPAFLYRRSVFKSIGTYNEAIRNNEDTAFDIKLGMTCTVAFLDRYVYLYFKHESSTIQTSKRQMPRAFMVWPRLVKEHLPFYLTNEVPICFKHLLFTQIYQSMGRQIEYTKGLSERKKLKSVLLDDINSINVPVLIKFYLNILVFFSFAPVRKIYSYYIVPAVIKNRSN